MGTPLFAAFRLFDPLQHMVGTFGRLFRRPPCPAEARAPAAPCVPVRMTAVAGGGAGRARPPRRLRVVRVFEGSQAAASAGRMVISGRMADVCAELDRLAALETAAG